MLFSKCLLKQRGVYAVKHGTYAGELLVFVKKDSTAYHFLCIPLLEKRNIPLKDVQQALDLKLLEFVEQLPNVMFKICVKQFYHTNIPKAPKYSHERTVNRAQDHSVTN